MTNEVLRIPADWLKNETSPGNGVNALLGDVPRDAGDPVPPAVTVYDASRHGWAARRMLPREGADVQFPLLVLMLANDLELDGEVQTTYRDGRASVLIGYVHEEVDTQTALAACGYTLRAAQRSLARLHANTPALQRNLIALKVCSGIREVPAGLLERLGIDIRVTAALVVSYDVRDLAP